MSSIPHSVSLNQFSLRAHSTNSLLAKTSAPSSSSKLHYTILERLYKLSRHLAGITERGRYLSQNNFLFFNYHHHIGCLQAGKVKWGYILQPTWQAASKHLTVNEGKTWKLLLQVAVYIGTEYNWGNRPSFPIPFSLTIWCHKATQARVRLGLYVLHLWLGSPKPSASKCL